MPQLLQDIVFILTAVSGFTLAVRGLRMWFERGEGRRTRVAGQDARGG